MGYTRGLGDDLGKTKTVGYTIVFEIINKGIKTIRKPSCTVLSVFVLNAVHTGFFLNVNLKVLNHCLLFLTKCT